MASDQQVALARTPRGSTSNLTKTARQVVPAFLQKLYEMVNDHSNNDLIRWSETGDSFFVLDHDRFAKEVLGRWFKHQNFSSFVRQLNMYGFHKIPHLQQGVLKSDADTEFWNFEHPNFRCGQPDLLCLIQRKKQAQPSGTEDHLLETARDPSNPAATNGPLSAGQLLDINTVVNGIAAIKRHQTAISDDLNVLKTSNEQLWQEAIASRERHQKQQDTINRILKFLAGVFGQQGAPKHDGSQTPPAMMPRKRQRLMIGDMDRIAGKTRAAEVADVDEEDEEMPLRSPASTDRGHSPFSGIQMARIDTPTSTVPPSEAAYSPAPTDNSMGYLGPGLYSGSGSTPVTPATLLTPANERPRGTPTVGSPLLSSPDKQLGVNSHAGAQPNGISPSIPSIPAAQQPLHNPTQTGDPYAAPHADQGIGPSSFNPSTITSLTTTNPSNMDPASLQAAFQQMFNTPAQMQRFFQALNNGGNFPAYPVPVDPSQQYGQPNYPSGIDSQGQTQQLQQYRVPSPVLYSPQPPESSQLQSMDNTGIVEPLMQDTERLAKCYKDAAEIERDVEDLQTSIYSLIENLGLDPSALHTSNANGIAPTNANGVHTNGVHTNGLHHPPNLHLNAEPSTSQNSDDFDFNAFLTEFSKDGDVNADYGDFAEKLVNQTPGINDNPAVQDASTEQLTAFLDEVASNASGDAHSPAHSAFHSPQLQPQNVKVGQKRKSDASPLADQVTTNGDLGGAKTKRKK